MLRIVSVVSCSLLLSFVVISVVCQDKIKINIDTDTSSAKGLSKDFSKAQTTEKPNSLENNRELVCPDKETPKPLLTLPCTTTKDCDIFGKNTLCCEKSCLTGIRPPKHSLDESNSTLSNEIAKDDRQTDTITNKDSITYTLKLSCPGKEVSRPFFALPCAKHSDCSIFGKTTLCCDNRCIAGVEPPKPELGHSATLFGFVKQVCPKEPLPEIWEIKECKTDSDCAPRICCPDKLKSGENVSYCRIPQPLWEELPGAKQFVTPIKEFVGYVQCTPPPPPHWDLFPKPCQNPLDCFPNLCCQEGGKRFCRPPKRSLLALIADVGQKIIPTDAAREFIEKIS